MTFQKKFFDIIGDVHGDKVQLVALLEKLGYERDRVTETYFHTNSIAVFCGDLIDRGPDSASVVEIVKRMCNSNGAVCVLGNHEVNAILFNSMLREDWVKKREGVSWENHLSTLKSYDGNNELYIQHNKWLATLPLYYENEFFRVVHAAWNEEALRSVANCFYSKSNQELCISDWQRLKKPIEILTKGIYINLKPPYLVTDWIGRKKAKLYLAWWMQLTDNSSVFESVFPSYPFLDIQESSLANFENISASFSQGYLPESIPVFFGHYRIPLEIESIWGNAICVDRWDDRKMRLTAYRFDTENPVVSNKNFVQSV